jgi:hypothetical protein
MQQGYGIGPPCSDGTSAVCWSIRVTIFLAGVYPRNLAFGSRCETYMTETNCKGGPTNDYPCIMPEILGGAMKKWLSELIRLGKSRGYVTYTEVSTYLPDGDIDEKLNELFALLKREMIGLHAHPCSESPTESAPRRQAEVYRPDPDLLEGWKRYPLRVRGPKRSDCHCPGGTTLLFPKSAGGFVRAHCSECGKENPLAREEFLDLPLWVSCPRCRTQMQPDRERLKSQSYGFRCGACQVVVLLADLLPSWEDVRPAGRPG